VSHAQLRAQELPEAAGLTQEEQEREIDKQHLRKIYDAIQAYKKSTANCRIGSPIFTLNS